MKQMDTELGINLDLLSHVDSLPEKDLVSIYVLLLYTY